MGGACAPEGRPRRACVIWAAMVLMQVAAATDWDRSCPKNCKCTYVSNRKMADCQSVDFSTVPSSLSPEVQELNLAHNNIMYLEKDAFKKTGLVNVQKLYLRDNNIREVHKDAFRDLRIMIELDLSGNKIDKLHPGTFTGLEKLRVLDLSGNELLRLEGRQFPPLPHLRKLDFRDNQLVYIHNYAFSALPLLTSLRLSGNKLKLVQPELFSNNSNLVELELHDNLWECDCNLKNLVNWVKKKSLLQEHVKCHSPERLSGRRLESVSEELACRPELIVTQAQVPAAPGQNASLTCRARGEPLPQVKWVLQGRVLTNMSVIPFSAPEQRYVVREVVEGGDRWSQLTVTHVQEHDLTYYTCVADNLAGLVEHNVSLIAAAPTQTGAVAPKAAFDLYVIIGIVAGGLVLLLVLIVALCCCWKRRKAREMKQRPKVNGVVGGSHMEHKNVMIVNPVEKPPRQYEQVPQTDLEMTPLPSDVGAHRSYDEVDYPEAGPATLRTPLATLEEEDDDQPSQDTTLPLDTTSATPSHSVVADYLGHYPDLLDMTRPRAVSPTQLSYHSLVAPHFTTPGGEYRYSYVHPTEYVHYPVAYVAPQPVQPRPGYVTLPRRHRSPSWAGQSSFEQEASPHPPPPLQDGEKPARFDPIYDTLGPRTTADGTSRTDLTRPTLRAAEPFTPRTPQSPGSPPSLPPYYTPVSAATQGRPLHQRNHSSTLPRSTPNLLDGGLSRPLPNPQTHNDGVGAHLVTTRSPIPHLPAHSPTPSNASTARTASPSYRAASPASLATHLPPSATPLNGHAVSTPSGSPLASSNESTLDSSQLYNNNNNTTTTSKMGDGTGVGDLSMASLSSLTSSGSKKVPPKPPPKPSAKRLSVASTTSDSRKSSVVGDSGRVFQDEGPDGTEV